MGKLSRRDITRKGKEAKVAKDASRGSPLQGHRWDATSSPLFSWANPPSSILSQVFDLLNDPRDLAAAACTCRSWAEEASRDHRWHLAWSRAVSGNGLWRWSRARGGYREQLRAKNAIHKGDAVASTFPFNRRDGLVSEVLMLDAMPEPRIITFQVSRPPQQSVRLAGATMKVWNATALTAQRPLLVVYDVIKQLQLEDGRLFCWRIADDAFVRMRCCDDAPAAEQWEARHWAEHPSIVPTVLDPTSLALVDVPLESSYGTGSTPHEWMDMCAGAVASGSACHVARRLSIRLFDLESGKCFCESSCAMPEVEDAMPLHPDSCFVLLSRNSDAEHQVVAAATLFDCRLFQWRLKDEWLTHEARRRAIARLQNQHSSDRVTSPNSLCRFGNDDEDGAGSGYIDAEATSSRDATPEETFRAMPHLSSSHDCHMRHIFTTTEAEPIVDLSISTSAQRIYVLCLENLFVLDANGRLKLSCNMASWRGARPPRSALGPFDCGAFSWPLPNSSWTAFYLDSSNSLFLANFEESSFQDYLRTRQTFLSSVPGQYPDIDRAYGRRTDEGLPGAHNWAYLIQCHVDLRYPPRAQTIGTSTGRITRPVDNEQVIVEYTQSGDVIFTSGDATCPSTAALLRNEKDKGTYLEGLGCHAAVKSGRRLGPMVSQQGDGGGFLAPLAQRALVCIDATTGHRFKTIPIEGSIESVHSAGHFVIVAVGPIVGGRYAPDGTHGALVVLDFTQEGFGVSQDLESGISSKMTEKSNNMNDAIEPVKTSSKHSCIKASVHPSIPNNTSRRAANPRNGTAGCMGGSDTADSRRKGKQTSVAFRQRRADSKRRRRSKRTRSQDPGE